ncbi:MULTISPECIES: hypothetical protein [Rahnella]|uniref:DUF1240 domain-containing protein n=1 Tax=Rahnella laticis TaxID=2787622 RepID=A0ABS0E1A1_9GAMM|nr:MULTISPECIES: hypothetical protein [Rahnella]MBF7978877.1 hypothetical protein [Rahnella laticis]MBF7998967.1 hypothetical protein [Rahnella sp. LAC-M12]
MKEFNFSTWILYKSAALFLVLLAIGLIYFIVFYGELYEVLSFIKRPDVMMFESQSLVAVGTIPALIYLFFFSLRIIFSKGLLAPRKKSAIGDFFLAFSTVIFVISFIAMCIAPFVLFASSYTHCDEKVLKRYYVINPQLCKTIIPRYWLSYDGK